MTTLQQALHIFHKDARHLRLEIAGIFVLLFFLVISGAESWESIQERGRAVSGDNPLIVLLPVAWALLIARAIQTEALPGDRHFWLTRPYSRTGLVLSKVLVAVAFIIVPFAIAQASIVWLDGLPLFSNLPGLVWNQVLIAVMLLLPVAAIAALTRNLAQFLPAVVLVGGLLAAPVAEGQSSAFGDFEWIPNTFGLMMATAIGSFIIWRQYRLRRSMNTAMYGAVATVVAVILYLSFPQSAAFAIQSSFVGSQDTKFALQLGPAEPVKDSTETTNRYQQLILLPLTVSGAAPENLRVNSSTVTFKTLAGISRSRRARTDVMPRKLLHTASLDREFFEVAKDAPVNIRSEFSLTQYGNAGSMEVPLDGTPVFILGPGQCGVVANYDQREFVCRSVFRSVDPLFPDRRVGGGGRLRDYSPYPATIRIFPVEARRFEFNGEQTLAPAVPETPLTVVVREPVAYFRYTLNIPNVRLANYAAPWGRYEGEQ